MPKVISVLVVEDDPRDRSAVVRVIEEAELPAIGVTCEVREAANSTQALEALELSLPDVILLDLQLDPGDKTGNSGIELLDRISKRYPKVVVGVVSQVKDPRILARCVDGGAVTMHLKPFNRSHLASVLQRVGVNLRDEESFGTTRSIKDFLAMIDQMKRRKKLVPIHLTGETGSGKTMMGEEIHDRIGRHGKFIARDCGAIPGELFESEMFGHVKNSFPGATEHSGDFSLASGGTLFLDEVGNLSPGHQRKLLGCLKGGTKVQCRRVGSERTDELDVLVITATNLDLQRMCAEGTFNEALYYRLTSLSYAIAPLRDRLHEIPLVVEALFRRFRKDGETIFGIEPGALALLQEPRPWPGNVRELKSVLEVALLRSARPGMIDSAAVEMALCRRPQQPVVAGAGHVGDLGFGISLDKLPKENELQLFVNLARQAIERLRSANEEVTGEAIATALQMSRASYFKKLKDARDLGLSGVDELGR